MNPDDNFDILDAMLNSYAQALDDTIEAIDSIVMAVPSTCCADSVHTVLNLIKDHLQAQIDEIDASDDEQPDLPPDHLVHALSAFFGGNVEFVRLEPTQG